MTSTYFLNCIMGNVFGTQTTPALPTRFYLGLSSTEPQLDGTGVTEPTDSSYTRLELDTLTEPEDGIISNDQDIIFPESVNDWSTLDAPLTHFVIFDALTGGHLLIADELDKPRAVQSDSQVRFRAGGLELSLVNLEDVEEVTTP